MQRPVDTVTPEDLKKVDQVIFKYRGKHGSLIPALKESQDICGYLRKQVQRRIAEGLSLSPSQVYGVVSFYAFFTTVPRGRHVIRVCLGTACYVKGSKQIVEKIEQELGLKVGGITKDRKYSLEAVRCLGCCSLAPAMVIDNETHALVDPSEAVKILRSYE
ncbi:MAG: NAD(P)H-dependent oxidoreductase subunit E [Deltaproteobacteria bacterium]|nr:MAG: NAD(P)H-dependent oxidoreductase subunit E [Deltaproteobacteria bacterium]